jgi:hypothetical protein
MGKPLNRRGTLSLRAIPRNIIKWLDATFSLDGYAIDNSSSSSLTSNSGGSGGFSRNSSLTSSSSISNSASNDSRLSWLSVGNSAITNQQQINSYDCGVACLLYAEKCALMQPKEDINSLTTQNDISNYRRILQIFHKNMSSDNF